jgi:hypothetical protein
LFVDGKKIVAGGYLATQDQAKLAARQTKLAARLADF